MKKTTFIATFLIALNTQAASFDCRKASMPSEKIICSNPALSKLDDQMSASYSRLKSETVNFEILKSEQISWIKEVRACGTDEECISSLYIKRINQLTPATSSISENTLPIIHAAQADTNEMASSTEAQASIIEKTINFSSSDQMKQNIESQISPTPISDVDKNENKKTFSPTVTESSIAYATGLLLYLFSFIVYVKSPKLRKISISTPFDIGCSNELTEAEQAVKGKKQWIEFGLLLLSFVIYLFVLSSGLESGAGVLNAITSSILAFLAAFSTVVVARLLAGLATRCPKCKNTFASKCTNSYTEPKSTYEKISNGTSGSRRVQFVKIIETGVKHSDYLCTVCSHEWQVANQYTKQLSEHMRG